MLLRVFLLFVMFVFLARAVRRLLEGVARGAAGPEGTGRPRSGASQGVKMAKCPACGTYVVPGKSISALRGGRAVYYCSEKCRDAA